MTLILDRPIRIVATAASGTPPKRKPLDISNLDVTLRDGGYRNLFRFTTEYAAAHVRAMDEAGVDWIEVGYRNGSFKPIANIGQTGMSADPYLRKLREAAGRRCLCVMVHAKNIGPDDLKQMRDVGVDMVRFCADPELMPLTLKYVGLAKALDYTVCFNLTRISEYDVKELADMAEQGAEAGADVVYLADSNGSMRPAHVELLVTVIRQMCKSRVGFHAHDNLGLSMANSIAAVNGGATFIDSSLRGMGKGAGNLKLELWLSYLRLEHGTSQYDSATLLDQVDLLERSCAEAKPMQPIEDLIMGESGLNAEHRERLRANATRPSDMLANAMRLMEDNSLAAG